jgi:glycosyltransferase involved in cell wall biosynthesis
MRVLAIYHATQTPDGLAMFRALAQISEIELFVIAPSKVSVNPVYDVRGYLEIDSSQEIDGYQLIPCALLDSTNYTLGWNTYELFPLIDRIKPDIIHVFDEAFSKAIAQVSEYTKKSKIPLAFYAFENMPLSNGIRSRLRYINAWQGVSGGGAATSEARQRLYDVGFSRKKVVEIIPWSVDISLFSRILDSPVRKLLSADANFIVGYVGRLAEEKGILVLLDSLKLLPKSVHAIIVGSGPLEDTIRQLSNDPELESRVHLYPAQPASKISEFYSAMNTLVVPSLQTQHWKEQFGRVIPEAMACGIPVIGSSSGAIPDVIGGAGIIVKEGSAQEVAEAIELLQTDKHKREVLSQLGIERVNKYFSSETMAHNLAELYRKLTNPNA